MLKSFVLSVTFSHYGTKETISKSFNGGNVYKQEVEVSEFVGTLEEFHSGTYYEQIKLDVSKDLETQVKEYLKQNNKEEYFSLYDMDNTFLFNECNEYGDVFYINGEPYKSSIFTDVKTLLSEIKELVCDGSNIEYTRGAIELVASFLKHNNNDTICSSDTKIFIAKYIGLSDEIISQL